MILYQILMAFALPGFLLHALWRGGWPEVRQRLGLGAGPAHLWIHGASVGELTSAKWVIDALIAARPGLTLVVTSNTQTGRRLVDSWGLGGITSRLAPIDGAGAAGRMLDDMAPRALIIIENELWPARIAAASRRGAQVLVIGARLSARSAGRWARWPDLIETTLSQIDWLSAQDDASAARLLDLGLPPASLGPVVTLKAHALPGLQPPPFAPLAPRAKTLLSASTHEGEEDGILQAFAHARKIGGPQTLILAPRHPDRGDQIAAMISARGLSFARRSKGQVPPPGTAVLLADTMGEMSLWYAMSGICLIGGSFSDRGGHTPFEPASFGCALLHGPSVHNFAAPFAALDFGGGAVRVAHLGALEQALLAMTEDRQASVAGSMPACLAPFAQGSGTIIDRLLSVLPKDLR